MSKPQIILPERRREPFRIWYEFLKCALRDPDIQVDKKLYKDWGDVSALKFNDWWKDHWQSLFGVSIGVREIVDVRDYEAAKTDAASILMRIPLDQNAKEVIADVSELMAEAKSRRRNLKKARGKFALTGTTQPKVAKLRSYLKCYQLALDGSDVESVAKDYLTWVKNWNDQVQKKENAWNRQLIKYPAHLDAYVRFLKTRDESEEKRGDTGLSSASGGYAPDNLRRTTNRLIRNGRKIAHNVAKGEFPGEY